MGWDFDFVLGVLEISLFFGFFWGRGFLQGGRMLGFSQAGIVDQFLSFSPHFFFKSNGDVYPLTFPSAFLAPLSHPSTNPFNQPFFQTKHPPPPPGRLQEYLDAIPYPPFSFFSLFLRHFSCSLTPRPSQVLVKLSTQKISPLK